MQAILVVTTVGTEEEANLLGQELVERRHSCCVNILPIHRSIYRWQGKICTDSEFMLIIKAMEAEYAAIEATIKELHSYELPEILGLRHQEGRGGLSALDPCMQLRRCGRARAGRKLAPVSSRVQGRAQVADEVL